MISVPAVFNPVAGGGTRHRHRRSAEVAAEACGARLEWWPTRGPGHAAELGARAAAEGRPLVLAFGGDGTYNELARGLLGTETSLGPVPAGTTSVLAYELQVPRPLDRGVRALLCGVDRPMSVGRTDRGDLFLLMLSAGPDSLVLQRLRPAWKRLGGRVGVAVQAAEQFLRGELPRLRVRTCGEHIDCGWVIAGNAKSYAGPFHATPGADPFAAELEVVVQTSVGRGPAVACALSIPWQGHVRRRDVLRRTVREVEIETLRADAATAFQVDGDVAGELPVKAWIDPERLRVRLPAQPSAVSNRAEE